jgi:hypothetical protein
MMLKVNSNGGTAVIVSLLDPNIIFSTLFSHTLNLSFLRETEFYTDANDDTKLVLYILTFAL